jgi:cytochrome c oxidase subunit 2
MVRLTGSILRRPVAQAGLAGAMLIGFAGAAFAAQPHPWQLGFQPPATPITERVDSFHHELLIIITVITIFVMGLLGYVMYRFSAKRHPVPTRTSHNTMIEILWTVIPIVILVTIAIPSFKLMYYMDEVPKADMTIKVTAHQWYWSYEYPDQKVGFDSNLVQDKDLKPGQKRLLAVDNPLVVPADTTIRVQVTGTDVIHSWFVPSFGVQEYAIIGRLNEAWMKVLKPGTYFGECNQICGVNHAFMPIEVQVLSKADYAKWLGDAKKKFALNEPETAPPAAPEPRLAAAGN